MRPPKTPAAKRVHLLPPGRYSFPRWMGPDNSRCECIPTNLSGDPSPQGDQPRSGRRYVLPSNHTPRNADPVQKSDCTARPCLSKTRPDALASRPIHPGSRRSSDGHVTETYDTQSKRRQVHGKGDGMCQTRPTALPPMLTNGPRRPSTHDL